MVRVIPGAVCIVSLLISAAGVFAQEDTTIPFRQSPYDGLQAGQDAYQMAEEQRQQNIANQAYLFDSIQSWRGRQGNTVYFRPYDYATEPGGGALRPNVTYGTHWGGGIGGYGNYDYRSVYGDEAGQYDDGYNGYTPTPVPAGRGYFRNRPYGATYWPGYTVVTPSYPTPLIRQPIGQWRGQTGPDRWESHPVYGDEPPPEEREPPASQEPIVKPKIIVPPREY